VVALPSLSPRNVLVPARRRAVCGLDLVLMREWRVAPGVCSRIQVAFSLSGANLYGYTKCSSAAKERMGGLASSVASSMLSQQFSRFTGSNPSPAGGNYSGVPTAGANNV
jgi:hypothetical protein